MKRGWMWTWALLAAGLGLSDTSWSLERMVGLVPSDGVAAFVKEFTVAEGTTLLGASFANNDPQTVFPDLFIVRGPASRLADGELLGLVADIQAGGSLVNVTWPAAILADVGSTYLVGARLPNGPGKQGVGAGPALGASDLPSPEGSFVAWGSEGVLYPIPIDLQIDLICTEPHSAKLRVPGSDGSENRPGPSSLPYLRVQSREGRHAIVFGLPTPAHLGLTVFDVAGRVLRKFPVEYLDSGSHQLNWNGQDAFGKPVPAGVYFVSMRYAGAPHLTRKFVLRP